jgi:peptidoglycan hydrolase-like protein with peptidoglycan-binding domain
MEMKRYIQVFLFVAVVGVFVLPTNALAVDGWIQSTGAGSRNWYSITSSSDGIKTAAVVQGGGYIYTSSDSGVNWTEQTGAGLRDWYDITSSSDGTKLAAAVNGGYIYTSTDSGVSWTEQTGSDSRGWWSITSSSDGTKLAAAVNGGYIYTSTDSGVSWTEQTIAGLRNWYDITSSSDGTKLAAAVNGGYIYTSTDSGVNWTEQTAAGSRYWRAVVSSSDGTKLAAVAFGLGSYTSTDSGISWTERAGSSARSWKSITFSSDDGTKLVAAVNGGYIYTYGPVTIVPPTLTTSAASSVITTTATLNGEITDTGYEDATQHGFAYGTSADLSTVIATTTLGTKSGTGVFTSDITGLTEGTTYYVRAYATNSSGTGYGSIETFATGVTAYISNCTELQAMSGNLDGNYVLSGNIDCSDTVNWNSGEGFVPVGTNVTPFTGSLEGAGYTISNLTINRPAEDYVGLFGWAEGITVQDLTITGSVEGSSYVGALAGRTNTGSISISNVNIGADVIGSNSYIGGIVGDAEGDSISITDSSMTGSVVVDGLNADSIGGLVGYIYASDATIDSSFNTGSIAVVTEDYAYYGIGGLVGYNDDVLDISNSYNTGNISVTAGTYTEYGIGGLVGYYYYAGTISNSYNIGDISVTSGTYSSHIGGLFGYADDDTTITNSFSQGNININSGTTVSFVGGVFGLWDYSPLSASDSYSSTNITINASSTISEVGGFIGALQDAGAVISESFSSGSVSATSDTLDYADIGGFMGEYTSSTLSLIYYDKTNSNQDLCISSIDPDPVSCTAIESNSTYFLGNNTSEPMASWNFSTIWSTVSGKLPILTALASPYTTLTTSSASSVTKTGAVLNATISTLSGGSSATVRGFAWGTSSTYSATTTSSGSFSTGAFTTTLSDLTCNTTYHFRAYATNPSTTGFSSDATFTTEACATASSGGGGGGSGSRARVVPSPIATTTPTTTRQTPKLLLNLKLGDSNPEVTTLQTILVSLGFLKVSPTGYFGPLTESALKAYQISKGIPPVGVVGPLTRASLNSLTLNSQTVTPPTNPIPPATTTPSIYTRNLDIGSTGDDVRSLQSFLTSKGYTVPSTGYFGPLTQSALAKFQKDNGISPAVGYFGPVTRGRVR